MLITFLAPAVWFIGSAAARTLRGIESRMLRELGGATRIEFHETPEIVLGDTAARELGEDGALLLRQSGNRCCLS